jgi:hypothetical protein
MAAVERLSNELYRCLPSMAESIENWMRTLAGTMSPGDYFRHPQAYPIFLLPLWIEQALRAEPDLVFQGDLIFSSMSIYYFIRVIDNIMDDGGKVEISLLPALGFFHTQWQRVYERYFPFAHPFWEYFQQIWFESGEVVYQDALLHDSSLEQFFAISGKKSHASRIPIAAVCYRYEQPHQLNGWLPFCERFERWNQMYNDIFGWVGDFQHRRTTFFLSEAQRRKLPGESVASWVAREGFDWAINLLNTWLVELYSSAQTLNIGDVINYLKLREMLLLKQTSEIKLRLPTFVKLLEALQKDSP